MTSSSYINHFVQPDTIIPDWTNPQTLNRYSYTLGNPVRYNDPSGHCPLCIVAAIVGGAVVGASIYSNFIHEPSKPADGNASDLSDLMWLGYEHAEHANIVGEGLQSLKNDPAVIEAQKEIIAQITRKKEYGKQDFTLKKIETGFVAAGPSKNWLIAAVEGNDAFWMVYKGKLSAAGIQVFKDKTIKLKWKIDDNFDFVPGKNRGLDYNVYAIPSYLGYNILGGAKETYPISAEWKETILPPSPCR